MGRIISVRTVASLLSLVALASVVEADDWPAYRHDLQRSGVSETGFAVPLHRQWTCVSAHYLTFLSRHFGRSLHDEFNDCDYPLGTTVTGSN